LTVPVPAQQVRKVVAKEQRGGGRGRRERRCGMSGQRLRGCC
jgi:hypothetical protein